VTAKRTRDSLEVTAEGAVRHASLLLVGVHHAVVNGAEDQATERGLRLLLPGAGAVSVKLERG